MWKSIEISQQTYFIYCNINDNKEEVTLILYDLKEAWCQTIAFKDVKLKVKVLNKRYDFNENNIKEALTTGELKFGAIEEQPHTSAIKQESLLLKVKYGIKNCVLNYEWSLRRQSQLEFQKDFVQPLLVALLGCYQQVEILTECIRKKDAELNQYRREGAVLSRRTLATKPFDFDSFNKVYGESNKTAINFKELAQYVLRTKDSTTTQTLNDYNKLQPTEDEKPNNLLNDRNKNELTPKRRQRRKELELLLVERHLKLRKEGLIYESSQSESLSSENSQVHDELKKEIIKEKQTVGKDSNTKTGNDGDDKLKPPRKSAISSSPIKQKREHKINEHPDSDSDSTNKLPKTKPKDKTNLKSFIDSNDDDDESKSPRKSTRSSSPIKRKREHKIVAHSDSDSDGTNKLPKTWPKDNNLKSFRDSNDEDKLKSPRKNARSSSPIKRKREHKIVEHSDSDGDDTNKLPKTWPKDNNNLKSFRDRKLNNSSKNSVKTSDVFEFSTDNEDNKTLGERKKSLQESQTKSPAALVSSPSGSKSLRHSPVAPVVDDLSSQLYNIKKELESLEAMRLADLRKRSCKA